MQALALYFLRLGAVGFGGPVALVARMERELVEERAWFSSREFADGVALAQIAPGPLAAQLAMYLGWLRGGALGATLCAIAFVIPSFAMVAAIAIAYVAVGDGGVLRAAFYGVGAVVVAILARSAGRLVRRTVASDRTLLLVAGANAIVVVATRREIVPVLFSTATLPLLLAAIGPRLRASLPALVVPFAPAPVASTAAAAMAADPPNLASITAFFAKSALVVFGSGLAIIPFLRAEVVEGRGWLTEPQFLDAIAVAMLTPGPVVITVAFIGWIVAGAWGGVAAAVGVFVPTWLVVVIAAPFFQRIRDVAWVRALSGGLTAAAAGALAGAVVVIALGTLVDVVTLAAALLAFGALLARPRLSEPALIAGGALFGLLLAPEPRAPAVADTPAPRPMHVLFVCEHGSAKSLIARLSFEEAAREAGLQVVAESRGTDPDAELPPWMRANLTASRMVSDDFGFTPRLAEASDVARAGVVVTFDLVPEAVPGLAGARAHERWDGMPPASEDFEASRAAIRARARALVDSLSRASRARR